MKYVPSAIPTTDLDTIKAPYFGGEFSVYLTAVASVLLGEIDFSAAGVATFTANAGSSIKTGGADLAVVPITPINSAVAVKIVMNVLDTSTTPLPAALTAIFQPPTRATNQTFNFARGYATDGAVTGAVLSTTFRERNGSNVAQLTVPNHGLITGTLVNVAGLGGTGYAATGVSITVVDVNNFTYPDTGALEATTPDTAGLVTVTSGTTKVSSIVGLGSVTGGGPNQKFRIYQLPEVTDYQLIEPTTEIDFNTRSRPAKGIDSGMEADAYVKAGKSQPGELNIGGKFKGVLESMARFDGQFCTAMLIGLKDGLDIGDRLVFVRYRPTIKPKLPDGDGEATDEAMGKFVDHLFFVAP